VVPLKHTKPIEEGIQDVLEMDILTGDPLVDIKVTMLEGRFDEVDSNEIPESDG
jgi:translation elongation factor EF-G